MTVDDIVVKAPRHRSAILPPGGVLWLRGPAWRFAAWWRGAGCGHG